MSPRASGPPSAEMGAYRECKKARTQRGVRASAGGLREGAAAGRKLTLYEKRPAWHPMAKFSAISGWRLLSGRAIRIPNAAFTRRRQVSWRNVDTCVLVRVTSAAMPIIVAVVRTPVAVLIAPISAFIAVIPPVAMIASFMALFVIALAVTTAVVVIAGALIVSVLTIVPLLVRRVPSFIFVAVSERRCTDDARRGNRNSNTRFGDHGHSLYYGKRIRRNSRALYALVIDCYRHTHCSPQADWTSVARSICIRYWTCCTETFPPRKFQ
jgi:hypothetical protein